MAPLLLPSLIGSLTRQLSHIMRYMAISSLPAAGTRRCISTVTATLTKTREVFSHTQGRYNPLRLPLLGQCQQVIGMQPCAGMKTKTALKRRCKDCFFVRRHGRLFVFCKTHPRHKQRQG